MKKNFKFYIACWAILLALFNVICFAIPKDLFGMDKFGGAFWVGYIFITVIFIGQLICAYYAFKAENLKRLFYNLPLITISYSCLITTIVIGGICMAIPNFPKWIGVIACSIIFALNAMSILKSVAATDIVERIDNKVRTQANFIKQLTLEAENLVSSAKDEKSKEMCQKVYDAVRYSDPMSNPELNVIEAKITIKMDEFKASITDSSNIEEKCNDLLVCIKERNNKCKSLK